VDKYEKILEARKRQLNKALDRLSYSYKKVKNLTLKAEDFDDETLETWESFSARFARASDIFLSQYLRTYVLITDNGFQGTMRDFLDAAEKFGLIGDAKVWMEIRELRNISAHEYTEEDLAAVFKRLLKECPKLLSIQEKINALN
jgi:hypothetical protein